MAVDGVLTLGDLSPLEQELNQLRAELTTWQQSQEHRVIVGAYTGTQGQTAAQQDFSYQDSQQTIGPLTMARVFESLPDVGKERWRTVKADSYFVSFKPSGGNPDNMINGTDKARFQALIAALPTGTKVAVNHEPENDMPATTFYALMQAVCAYVAEVRSDIEVWYAAMIYQWRVNGPYVTQADYDTWASVADLVHGVSVDIYASLWAGPRPYYEDPGFQRWSATVRDRAASQGKPWGISEMGIAANHPAGGSGGPVGGFATRRRVLRRSLQHAQDNQCDHLLLWDADWDTNLWKLTDPAEQRIYSDFALKGRCA